MKPFKLMEFPGLGFPFPFGLSFSGEAYVIFVSLSYTFFFSLKLNGNCPNQEFVEGLLYNWEVFHHLCLHELNSS